ncbi:MAG: carbohydrate-binding protein [Gemmatimonadota bacterium]
MQGFSTGWKVDDCLIEGFWGYAVIANWSRDASVINSELRRNGAAGIYLERGQHFDVRNNRIYENGANGVDLGVSDGYTSVASNTVYDNGWREWGGENNGILVLESSNNSIVSNTVYNTATGRQDRGITVYQGSNGGRTTSDNEVRANTISGHGQHGILVGMCTPEQQPPCLTTANTTVSSNTLYNNYLAGYQIGFIGSVTGGIVSNNVVTMPGPCYPSSYDGVIFQGNTCIQNAFAGIEGESYVEGQGVCIENGALACLESGDWARYATVDFGTTGALSVTFRIAVDACCAGRRIEMRLDSVSGTLIGTLVPESTGGWNSFKDQTTSVISTTGKFKAKAMTRNRVYVFPAAPLRASSQATGPNIRPWNSVRPVLNP